MHELKPCAKYRLVHAILVVEAESADEATDALNEQFNGHLQDGDFVVADWAFTDVVEASTGVEVEEGMFFRGQE